jgi:hypothetical protein
VNQFITLELWQAAGYSELLKRERFNFARILANMGTRWKAAVAEPDTATAS